MIRQWAGAGTRLTLSSTPVNDSVVVCSTFFVLNGNVMNACANSYNEI